MVWYFIGVYVIKRTLHGRLEIRNFSSRVEKIFHSKRNFVSPRGHVISSIYLNVTVQAIKRVVSLTWLSAVHIDYKVKRLQNSHRICLGR